jgi:class 3 adenylate cyclase/CheY-like chemotaxis protein
MTPQPKILVVDDEVANLQVMRGLLHPDYRVVVAKNGAKALDLASVDPHPDLVLLDIMMPGMSGYEVCEQLKANKQTSDIPVIFVTAMSEVEDEERGFDLGAVDYITKPISPPILLARVKTHLSLKATQESLERKNARLHDRLALLALVIQSLSEMADEDSVFRTLVEGAMNLVGAERGHVFVKPETGTFEARFSKGVDTDDTDSLAWDVARAIVDGVHSTNEAKHITDAAGDPTLAHLEKVRDFGRRSILGIPLFEGENVTGVIYLESSATGDFGEEDLEIGRALCDRAATALGRGALRRERARLHRFLERYVSPQVAQVLVENSESPTLACKETEVTILFADIIGFTALSERLSPTEVLEFLNEHFSLLVEVLYDHGGTIKQFAGDEVMAIFGAPSPLEDHTKSATLCALEMIRRFEQWQEERADAGLPTVGLKIGLHCGPVVVGSVGSTERMEYAAVGDVVNTASRVMGLASRFHLSNCVLASEDIVHHCPEEMFNARHLGTEDVKGRAKKVSVYELLPPPQTSAPA